MMTEIRFPLFGDELVIGFEDVDETRLEKNKEAIVKEALRLQRVFNFYDKHSELSKLNRERVHWASPELLFVLKTALTYCELTNGRYDISQGQAFLKRKAGSTVQVKDCSYKDIIINAEHVTLAHDDVLIDLGSIAKGYIADALETFIASRGFDQFFIDARGDVLFHNYRSEIGIQGSRTTAQVHEFTMKNGGVATSGDYLQYLGTYDENHLLGNQDYSSVTVVHDSLMIADVLATVISVTGKSLLAADLLAEEALYILDKEGIVAHNTLQLIEVRP